MLEIKYSCQNVFKLNPYAHAIKVRWERYQKVKDQKEKAWTQFTETAREINDPKFLVEDYQNYLKKYKALESLNPTVARNNKTTKGQTMSQRTKTKIKDNICKLYWKLKEGKNQVEFITLTVTGRKDGDKYNPERDDQLVKKCLQTWLDNMRKNYGLESYVYVAERQTGKRKSNNEVPTNALHYHLVTSWKTGIEKQKGGKLKNLRGMPPIQNVNLYWCLLLDKEGFKSISQKGIEFLQRNPDIQEMFYHKRFGYSIQAYCAIHDTLSPMQMKRHSKAELKEMGKEWQLFQLVCNPVDRQKINDLKGLRTYMTKYLGKGSNDNHKIYARIWGKSKDLDQIPNEVTINDEEYDRLLKKVVILKEFQIERIINAEKQIKAIYTRQILDDKQNWKKWYESWVQKIRDDRKKRALSETENNKKLLQ